MWKKAKALVEPLERLMTTLGTKGPKSNTTHSGGHSQITCFTKQQVSELQKQITANNFANSNNVLERARLRNFLFENFSIFKAFSPQPVPVPVVFSQTPLRVCKPQGFGVSSQHTFLNPVWTRNAFGRGSRNFSTFQPTVLNNVNNGTGGVVLALKPFSSFASKTGSLLLPKEEVLNQKNNKFGTIEKQRAEKKKSISKGIFEIVKISDNIEDNKNRPRVVRRSSIKNEAIEKFPEVINNSENVQVYMSFMLSSSIFWNLGDSSTSLSNSTNSANSVPTVLSCLLRNNTGSRRPNSRLNSSFVQHLQEIAEMQHDHMMEVISILGVLLRHGEFEVKISGCELRVNFPRGVHKSEIENMLESLGIDSNSPHFELEEFAIKSVESSSLIDEDNDMQLPEPNHSYFDSELIEATTIRDLSSSPGYEVLSYSSSKDSSPVLLPSRGSMDYISGFSSPCISPVNSPPRLGSEYITSIQEFLNAVDEALVRNTNMFNSRKNDEIGEDYYEN